MKVSSCSLLAVMALMAVVTPGMLDAAPMPQQGAPQQGPPGPPQQGPPQGPPPPGLPSPPQQGPPQGPPPGPQGPPPQRPPPGPQGPPQQGPPMTNGALMPSGDDLLQGEPFLPTPPPSGQMGGTVPPTETAPFDPSQIRGPPPQSLAAPRSDPFTGATSPQRPPAGLKTPMDTDTMTRFTFNMMTHLINMVVELRQKVDLLLGAKHGGSAPRSDPLLTEPAGGPPPLPPVPRGSRPPQLPPMEGDALGPSGAQPSTLPEDEPQVPGGQIPPPPQPRQPPPRQAGVQPPPQDRQPPLTQ